MYIYDVYHAEVEESYKRGYLSDKEIQEKALNSSNGAECYETDEPMTEDECINIYRYKSMCGLYVTGCTYYVLREGEGL